MQQPFPGMDPYLEEPSEWPDLLSRLITAISDALAALISPAYIVRVEQRVYITEPGDAGRQAIVPDVYLVRGPQTDLAVATAPAIFAPTLIEPLYEPEIRDRYIEVHDARNRDLVTTIEILSPFNKASGTTRREQFLRKRRALTMSKTHWIEIDLLRAGERPPEVAGLSDYYTLLSRGASHEPYAVWFSNLRDRLPTIAVPLRSPHADVPLDLQAVFDGIYARAFYGASIDYTRPLPPPTLLPADARWAAEQVRHWQADRHNNTNDG